MAKKRTDEKINYGAQIRELKENGPQRLYLLYGPEDYLREQYYLNLKKICLPVEDDFSYKRFQTEEPDPNDLKFAIDAMPFMTERTFIELRDMDINKVKNQDEYVSILSDIPDYCTVAVILNRDYEPDGRMKLVKHLKEHSVCLRFNEQDQGPLLDWIRRRFEAYGKGVELEAACRLIFLCGNLMNNLIPEIEKIASYSEHEKVTLEDVNTIAVPVPDAVVFQMTEFIADKRFNNAFDVLHDLLTGDNEPIALLAMIGIQMRRLYAAKLALIDRLGAEYLVQNCGIKYESLARQTMRAAEKFSLNQLKRAVVNCAEADYQMKNGGDPEKILMDIIINIAADA